MRSDPLNSTWHRLACVLVAGLLFVGCDDGGGGGGAGGAGGVGGAPDGGGADAAGGQGGMGGMGCVPGTATCPCASDGTCAAGLACELGFCVPDDTPPTCEPGTESCPCAGGMCGPGLSCTADVCVPTGCTPGTARCACDEGRCDDGLACQEGVCGLADPPPQDSLRVGGGDLRGCDVLFREGAVAVARVQFADGLVGEWLRRDGRVALAFVGSGGAAITNVGAVVLANERVATAADLAPLETRCFDASGRPVAGATLTFE